MESKSFMKPLTSFIQGISIVTPEMSDAVFYETKLCLTYIPIFLTFLPRVKLQSQQTNNGFKSKNGIIYTCDSWLFIGGFFFHYIPFFGGGGGCSTNFVSDRPRFFFCVVDQFLLLKKQLNRESSNILSVVRRSSFRHFNCS